jgi:two-component system, NtrC family, nitrogen regulation sensor histidine kinase NtrY
MVAEQTPDGVMVDKSVWLRLGRWLGRVVLSRLFALALVAAALVSGVLTYRALTSTMSLALDANTVRVLLLFDLVLVLMLCVVVLGRVVQLWIERRRGSAGSRLHIRLATLFSVVAVAPAIIVAVFSVLFLNLGLESWFSERVRTALDESMAVAVAYINEHRQIIRGDVLAMANDINRASPTLRNNSARFNGFLETQAALRALTEAMVLNSDGKIYGRTGLTFSLMLERIPPQLFERANRGEVVVITSGTDERVRALVRLKAFIDTYLLVGRVVDAVAMGHMERTQQAVAEYKQLEGERYNIQVTFALIFSLIALLLLLASVWMGLTFATHLARPVSRLIVAAERVRSGDLTVRVDEGPANDEIGSLSRAFNRMTGQLDGQRQELVEANRQLDARRRFTESVLSGVTAGVIGLDPTGTIELPNRSALVLLAARADDLTGHKLADAVAEMAPLMGEAMNRPGRRAEAEISIEREGRKRTLMVRIAAERLAGELEGFVVTFDDITALVVAQRTAAWADVARRIAHEIKNPLTPIQLSAERIKRKYLHEIQTDVDVFSECIDTIVRQVGDIGRLIDEFSSFARMPAPVFRNEDALALVHQSITLQKAANPDIEFVEVVPDHPVGLRCDAQHVAQVLTNLVQNAADSIEGRDPPLDGELAPGRITLTVNQDGDNHTVIEIEDNGRGLPGEQRDRLVEPYVTTRAKGTGLGLAIVKKIMEDHRGELMLGDAPDGGARIRLIFPAADEDTAGNADQPSEIPKVASHGA